MQISCKSPGHSDLFCVGLCSCNAAGNCSTLNSYPVSVKTGWGAQGSSISSQVSWGQGFSPAFPYQCFFRGYLPFTLFTIIHHQEKQHSLGNQEETKKMNFSSKMHKEQNPFVFSLLLNFPQERTAHKHNRHTCIQIPLSFPRNSRLLIPSPDNYISFLLRQIMAQIVTQNRLSGKEDVQSSPSSCFWCNCHHGIFGHSFHHWRYAHLTMERCTIFYQSYFYSHYLGPVPNVRIPVFIFF